MLDLVRTAWSVDAAKVYGGPAWLDYDRFDVIAKAPAQTTPSNLRLMLRSLLEDRFHLLVREDTKPMPAWVLSTGKDAPKMRRSDGSGRAGCESLPTTVNNGAVQNAIRCRDVTLRAFAAALRLLEPTGYFGNLPVVDATGISGVWDIDLQYAGQFIRQGSVAAALPPTSAGGIPEPLSKQLGLTLRLGRVSQPVLSVESVNQQPTANSPSVASSAAPAATREFEVRARSSRAMAMMLACYRDSSPADSSVPAVCF